ncbi:Fe(3+) ABC transporter substrate-binding protein [Stenomitos frigidus]|nr:Fe(3+) ABC transporter substrate-binding protein [Stenomitos frigidus]
MTRRVFLGAGAAAVAVAGGCARRSGVEEAQTNRVVNLYSARHYDTDNALYESFTQKTGIKVNLVEAEADKLIERLRSEGANSPADVLITVDAGRLWRAQEAGLLQPVTSQVLQTTVPKSLQEEGGHWFGLSRRARVIVYNKEKVKPSDLSTYEDLTNPKWKGRFVVRSSSSVYNQSLTGALLAALKPQKTEAWAKGLVANFARPPEGNDTAQIKAVATGIGDITLVNTYYVARLLNSKKADEQAIAAKVGVFFPNQGNGDRGAHVNICGGGVVKTAPNRDAAVQFLEHMVSPAAQEIFASRSYEYPVTEQAAIDPAVKGFGPFKADALNAAIYGRNNAEALQLMDRAGWT